MELSPRRVKASGSRRPAAVQSLVQRGVGQGAESERLLPTSGEFAISGNSQSTSSKYAQTTLVRNDNVIETLAPD
jgi:hypothetical protein